MMNLKRLVWLVSLSGAAGASLAAQPLVTDDTGTQGRGGHQLELSHTDNRLQQGSASSRDRASAATYSFGLADQVDLFFSGSARAQRSTELGASSGAGNMVLGLKWRLWEGPGLSLAVKPEWALPVKPAREAAGLGTGRHSYALTAIASQDTPFGAVHVNAAWGRDRFRSAQDNESLRRYSIAPVWEINTSWKLALDAGLQMRRSASGLRLRSRFVELGAIYSPDKAQDWALGMMRSSDNDRPETSQSTLTGGWTWRF